MSIKHFALPDPGEGLTEADIVTWRVAVGDRVEVNDIVVEVETAKSLVELPIPFAGTVAELLVAEGETAEVGSHIIAIEVEGASVGDAGQASTSTEAASEAADEPPLPTLVGYGAKDTVPTRRRGRRGGRGGGSGAESAPTPSAPAASEGAGLDAQAAGGAAVEESRPPRTLAKPPVRKLAKDRGLDLAAIPPSGEGGIVTREDVLRAAEGGAPSATSRAGASSAGASPAQAASGSASASGGRADVRLPVKGVRKATAEAMVASAFTAPHVTEFLTIDVTASMELLDRLRADRAFADVKLTPLALVAKALCVAVRRHPEVNATWDEGAQEIVVKGAVNLGIAAATPRGLMVPNIKSADRLDLRALAEAIGSLARTAREGRTTPADFAQGSITITNVGVFGVDTGTPILNPGEAAILAFGQVRRMPWVVQDAAGERIEPRWVTQLALSFDHRMVDGELGSKVLADIGALLHDPGRALAWT